MSGSDARFLRVSLRELLLTIAFVALACTSLKYSGDIWWAVLSSVTLLAFLAAAVVAVVDRGQNQAFALGFVLCVGLYGLILLLAPKSAGPVPISRELDPAAGSLPTSRLLGLVFAKTAVRKWINPMTGQEIPNYDPSAPGTGGFNAMGAGGGMSGSGAAMAAGMGGAMGGSFMSVIESPDRSAFMSVGHLLWALLLGYLGARLGIIVFVRRTRRENERPAQA